MLSTSAIAANKVAFGGAHSSTQRVSERLGMRDLYAQPQLFLSPAQAECRQAHAAAGAVGRQFRRLA